MKRRNRRRRGSATIVSIGVAAVILLFGLFFLELQQMYDYQYAIEVRAQRAINSCVEYAMDDQYRADGFNVMDKNKARNALESYLDEDLNVNPSTKECRDDNGDLLYKVTYKNITYYDGKPDTAHGPGIEMDITVQMKAGLGAAFGVSGYTWTNHYSSLNFRTDDDVRAGVWRG